jgi:hypothetical protein
MELLRTSRPLRIGGVSDGVSAEILEHPVLVVVPRVHPALLAVRLELTAMLGEAALSVAGQLAAAIEAACGPVLRVDWKLVDVVCHIVLSCSKAQNRRTG